MLFWPGVDKWPPPRWVWIAAAVMAFVVTPILILIGGVGTIIYLVIVLVVAIVGANARLRNVDAEAFWKSRPKD